MASFRGLLTPKRSFLSSRLPFQRIRRFRAVPGGQGFTNVYTRDYDLKLNRRISNLGRVFDYVKRSCVRRTSSAGKCLSFGALFGVPVATGLYGLYSKVYSMDEDKFLVEAHDSDISMQWKELWMWATRLWLPIVSVVTVLIGWRHPLSLAIDFALLLFTTKPSPHSVYLFIEQWQHPSVWRQGLDRRKLFSTKKVKFQDYGLLSMAWVEFGDEEVTLVGILGGWWVLHGSCSEHATHLGTSYLLW
ncbi:unnamed protein product [Victoria cruziana]